MAFMVPVVKKDYDIYSKSPPKNKPIVTKSNTNEESNGVHRLQRQQSNSITIGLLQHKLQQQRNPRRVHSKSVNETQINRVNTERHRSTSNSSGSDTSSDSIEIIRKVIHYISNSSGSQQTNDNNQTKTNKQTSNVKTHWTTKIFGKRKNSLNSHKLS